jgi:hypothetical protein
MAALLLVLSLIALDASHLPARTDEAIE